VENANASPGEILVILVFEPTPALLVEVGARAAEPNYRPVARGGDPGQGLSPP
jgi:hypothetical protein